MDRNRPAPGPARRSGLRLGVALAAFAPTLGALGQTRPPPAEPSAVAEVIVTAQKQDQRLQDVPVVVTVLSKAKLEAAQVSSVSDLTVLTAGLNVTTNGSESTTVARIRGVGNVADNPGLEDAVGLYIDGVYRPRNGVSFNDLGELSDIEVLKGPQGTLFGKNTIAGVIQVTTARPSFTFGSEGVFTVQNYGGYSGSVSVTGPIVPDKLAGRFYFAAKTRDGYIDVVQPPAGGVPSQNDEHVYTTRDQLLWTPTPDFDVKIIGDYTKRDDHCCGAVDYYNGQGATVGGVFTPGPTTIINSIFPGSVPTSVSAGHLTGYYNQTNIEHVIDTGVSATANWKTPWLGGARLTAITAYRDNRDKAGGDADRTLADILNAPAASNYINFSQFSQELQLGGSTDRLNWQAGGFLSHEVLDSGVFTAFGTQLGDYVAALSTLPAAGFAAGEGAIDTYHQVEQGEAIYTQETFTLTRHILITGGLRYTWEDKSLDSHYTNNDTTNLCATLLQIVTKSPTPVPYSEYGYFSKANFGIPCLINPAFKALGSTHQTLSEHALTGAAKIQYRFDSDNMAYAAYSRGNLVGGFNLAEVTQPYGAGGAPNTSLAPQTNTAFPAESVDAFEIGAKNALLHRHLTVDSALFYQTYYDHQLNAFTGTQFVEFTIPRAIAEGVETEIDWAAARGLVFNTGVTYADTYYPNSAINQAALEAPGSNLYLLPGKRLTYAPLWSVTAGGRYEHPIGGTLLLTATTDAKFTSSYSVGSDEDPLKNQKSYVLVDASLTLATVDKRYSVQLWATNLFNQTYKQTAFDGVIQTNSSPPAANPGLNNYYEFPGQPRFFGATIRVKY